MAWVCVRLLGSLGLALVDVLGWVLNLDDSRFRYFLHVSLLSVLGSPDRLDGTTVVIKAWQGIAGFTNMCGVKLYIGGRASAATVVVVV